jgi:hypothetical protein
MNHQIKLKDGAEAFAVSVFPASSPKQTALSAVGGGGNPERHATLLTTLAGQGCTVVAPHFERTASHMPGATELRRLSIASVSAHEVKGILSGERPFLAHHRTFLCVVGQPFIE